MRFGDAVVIDGNDINLVNNIAGGEVGVFYNTGGTSDYNALSNKPSINGVVVQGHKIGSDYRLQDKMSEVTPQDIDEIIYGG